MTQLLPALGFFHPTAGHKDASREEINVIRAAVVSGAGSVSFSFKYPG